MHVSWDYVSALQGSASLFGHNCRGFARDGADCQLDGVDPGLTFYSVLIYDFGDTEHCFMPVRSLLLTQPLGLEPCSCLGEPDVVLAQFQVRRYFDSITNSFFTLSETDRQVLSRRTASAIMTRTNDDGDAEGAL